MSRAASRICFACGRVTGWYPGRSNRGGQSNVVRALSASLAMSTSTGPGRPVDATWNASATTRGVRRVAATIDWLRHHGWHGLLANTIVVINHTKRRGSVSVEQFDELFRAGQKLRVHEIPYDPHLDSDQPIDIDLLRKRTVRAFEELAADLADGFNSGYEPPAAQKLAELQQVRTTEGR